MFTIGYIETFEEEVVYDVQLFITEKLLKSLSDNEFVSKNGFTIHGPAPLMNVSVAFTENSLYLGEMIMTLKEISEEMKQRIVQALADLGKQFPEKTCWFARGDVANPTLLEPIYHRVVKKTFMKRPCLKIKMSEAMYNWLGKQKPDYNASNGIHFTTNNCSEIVRITGNRKMWRLHLPKKIVEDGATIDDKLVLKDQHLLIAALKEMKEVCLKEEDWHFI